MGNYFNEILAVYLFINILASLYRRFFNIKMNVLNCGLVGFCGSEAPDMARIKILGMYNQARGKHSCGVYYDNLIWKGVDKEASFEDFIMNNVIEPVEGSNVVIAHTRHATYGSHTKENAHPFNIDNKIVLAHNGTIDNIWALTTKYDVDDKKIFVDSLALGILLDKVGVKVLEEYKGAAALLVTKLDEPNSLYVYHGASKATKDGKLLEERPLFMLKVHNGIYFSSLDYALYAIRYDETQVPEVVPYNKFIKVTNGKITKVQIKVNREEANVVAPIYYKSYVKPPAALPPPAASTNASLMEHKDPHPLVWYEAVPEKATGVSKDKNLLFFWKGRHWHLEGEEEYKLAHGGYHLNKKGLVCAADSNETQFFFWQGALLQSETVYKLIVENKELQVDLKEKNFARILSKYTRYPVTNLPDEAPDTMPIMKNVWYREQILSKGSFTPLFSNRNYCTNSQGELTKITCSDFRENAFYTDTSPKAEEKVEEVENYSDEVNQCMVFFKTVWHDLSTCLRQMNRTCELALRKYVDDIYIEYEEKNLTSEELTAQVTITVTDAVDSNFTIEEILAKSKNGKLEVYIKEILDSYDKEEHKNPHIEEFVENKNGILVPKDSITDDEDISYALPEKPDKDTISCIACAGLGIASNKGVCPICDGEGRVKNKQTNLFKGEQDDDARYAKMEEDYEKNSCSVTHEESKSSGENYEEEVMLENENAKDIVKDNVLRLLNEFNTQADDLQLLNNSPFAQEAAYEMYRILDYAKGSLKQVFTKYQQNNLLKELNKKNVNVW